MATQHTTKKDLSSRLVKTVPFLKAWARDPAKNAAQIAQEMGVSPDTLYKQIIPEFIGLFDAGQKQQDFPSNIVMYYNQHGSNSPDTVLTEQEVSALKPVFERERTRQPAQHQVYPAMPPQQDYVPPGYTQTTRGHGVRGPNLGTNAALISFIMERMRLAPQGQIPKFLEIFELNEDYYMTHPEKLQALFESQFTPLPGRMGFEQFMLSQPNYVYTGQRPGYGFAQPAMNTMSMGTGMGPMGPMPNPQDPAFQQMLNQQYLEDQKEDRRMRHQANMTSQMVQATMTNMMQRSMEAKQPIGPEALAVGDIEEQYDAEGNLVGRKILRKQGEGGGQGSSEPWKAIIELYKMEAANQREEKLTAMKSGEQPNQLMTTMVQSILNNSLKTDPIAFIKSIKEIGIDPFGNNQQNQMGGENIERWLDARLALQREELEILKIKHDWDVQDKANEEGKSNMQTFITGITGLVKDVAVPKLNKFIEGATNQMFQGGPQGPPQRAPPQAQYPPGPPNIQAPPGYRVVMTPQGPAYARIQQPQQGMGMPPQGQRMPSQQQGMGVPPTFEETEEQRLARQAQHIQHVANALNQKEQQLAAFEQEMVQREQSAAQASAYAETKVRQANEALRQAKFQEERQSFEEFTKEELSNIMNQMQAKLSQIQSAVVEKDKQELESQNKEVTVVDTEPIAVSDTDDAGVYQGEYEEDRAKLLKERGGGVNETDPGTAPA